MARQGMLARKSVAQTTAGRPGDDAMQKTLGLPSIIAIGVGAIIGAGIFVLTGTAAARYAGPAIMLSFVLGGIVCALVGLCYAELASMIPVSGSTYSYTYATLGEVFAWMIGWDLVLEYAMGAATVAVGWSGYFVSLLKEVGITIPPALTDHVNLPAAAIVGLLTALLVLGTKESARLNNVMVAVKLTVVLAFIAVGIFSVDPAHWHPLVPANAGEFGHFGASGILRGAGVVFFAYIGFDAVSTAAQEAKNPPARHARRHPGLPGHQHDPVHRRRRNHDRHRPPTTNSTSPTPSPRPSTSSAPTAAGAGSRCWSKSAPSPASPPSSWSCSTARPASSSPWPRTASSPACSPTSTPSSAPRSAASS